MGGRSTQVRHSNVITGQQLQLVFSYLTEANMLAVQMHYINRRGQFGTFSLPSAVWSGSTDRTISGYSWRYISMPKVDEPFCGRFTVSLTLEMVAEYAPPTATGDAYVLIPRAIVTMTALIPAVSGNAAVTVAIPAAAVTVTASAFAVQGAAIVQVPAVAVTVAALVPLQNSVVVPSALVTVSGLAPNLSP